MKAINATPREVRKIFDNNYVIPDFQRPYRWEEEHCDTLWGNIVDFHNLCTADIEKYFLGTIVIHPTNGGKFSVIDGQQRLTTLLLIIKALHTRAGTYSALQGCFRVLDKRDGSLTDELRVKSEVIAEDAENLRKIIFNDVESADDCQLVTNYKFLIEKIDEWLRFSDSDSDAFNALIDTLLDKIVLLPIECGSEDDALTIFQTINDTGMSLTDADIFKAKLYKSTPEAQRPKFIDDWNNLNDPERLFRIYMHIVRANSGDTSKEIGLRTFFNDRNANRLGNWSAVMESLKKISAIDLGGWLESGYGVIDSLWAILAVYPNQYWNYPIYVFLHKYGEYNDDDGFSLPVERRAELEKLLEECVRYYYIRGLVDNAVNTVKDLTFRVCAKIASDDDYIAEFKSGVQQKDKAVVSQKLEISALTRYNRGLVVLSAYLNPNQDKEKFAQMLQRKYEIEHILPKEWNHYDGWTQEKHNTFLNYLGNLMPLEKTKNIKAQNEYLRKKKIIYASSVVRDALDMIDIPDSGWTPSSVQDMHHIKIKRLADFLGLNRKSNFTCG